MSLPIAPGVLSPPTRPKVKDVDTERALAELERKLIEAQGIIRQLAARVP